MDDSKIFSCFSVIIIPCSFSNLNTRSLYGRLLDARRIIRIASNSFFVNNAFFSFGFISIIGPSLVSITEQIDSLLPCCFL